MTVSDASCDVWPADSRRGEILADYRRPEADVVENLLGHYQPPLAVTEKISQNAATLIHTLRQPAHRPRGVSRLLQQFPLSTDAGVALMCLAEALLRIPDSKTRNRLMRDKIATQPWRDFIKSGNGPAAQAATIGLWLASWVLRGDDGGSLPQRLAQMVGEPVIRNALLLTMRRMGQQFVLGQTIEAALERSIAKDNLRYRYSFDMLGEAAKTAEDAERYFQSYLGAVHITGQHAKMAGPILGPGISVKLSALYPRYEWLQRDRAMPAVAEKLLQLAVLAKRYDIHLCVDAEESDRLDLSFDIIERVLSVPELRGWNGFGLALQAYQKRAFAAVDFLADLAVRHKRVLMLRLVKGAYWDAEIKRCQERGLSDYPVFTRKANTDLSYLACAQKILACGDKVFYPQFGTHNVYTIAAIRELAGRRNYEFQRLHGMADNVYAALPELACRVYAPVGSHQDLLAYLVRRLLENGANSSFVYQILDAQVDADSLSRDPAGVVRGYADKSHPRIALPQNLFLPERENAMGFDLSNPQDLQNLQQSLARYQTQTWQAKPLLNNQIITSNDIGAVRNPADTRHLVGQVWHTPMADIPTAIATAQQAWPDWQAKPVAGRADALRRLAQSFEANRDELLALLLFEAGKTLADAVAEIREAVDFCRYYAAQAEALMARPMALPGPVGETNMLQLAGRGVFVCISPWNFPLAIFIGQIAAAIVTGNTVIAKPAEQTPLIAARAVALAHAAGIPETVLQFLPGAGETVGAALVAHPAVAGVVFTGGTTTAQRINQILAARTGAPIAALIAETGGQNAMIVDSSALPEQVVNDVIASAFQSAGQRCSALRVLYLQDEIYDKTLTMLIGAAKELVIGNPQQFKTDIGPLIDTAAVDNLRGHIQAMRNKNRILYEAALPADAKMGSYAAPTIIALDSIAELDREFFGPILHVVRYRSQDLEKVIGEINGTGYGLTFGIHSRVQSVVDFIQTRIRAGNIYVNRSIIGAVVGVQPFGGLGLSGTGPKAGGPHYLSRFVTEKTITVDTTAAGGNTRLLNSSENAA
jgi:RHH-type transcriptional regulator, proline utilization regulon repressor / proline dehydrogenase / delta 1-pyrroline-5-carboxylate dehydrogenase